MRGLYRFWGTRPWSMPVCPNFYPCVSQFFKFGGVWDSHTLVLFGCVGAHDHVPRPCPTSFASPTPVFQYACLCCFISLEHGWWARACHMTVLNSQFQLWFLDTDVSHAHVGLTDSPMATSHGRSHLSHPVLRKNFDLFSHGHNARLCLLSWCGHDLRHARVPCRVD